MYKENIIELNTNLEITLNNNKKIKYLHMTSFDNPVFKLVGAKNRFTIIDNVLYDINPYEEPGFPLNKEYQADKFFGEYSYDFYKAQFYKK